MSFIKFKQQPESELSIQLNAVPVPKTTDKYNAETIAKQQMDIVKVEARGKDLFQPNPTKTSMQEGKKLYQSTMLYSRNLSVEDLIPLMTSSELTLKVSAIRGGTSTCMELTSGKLADLIQEEADEKGDKVTKVELPDNANHNMYVAIKKYRGKHYIQKVDYEVDKEVDQKLHL